MRASRRISHCALLLALAVVAGLLVVAPTAPVRAASAPGMDAVVFAPFRAADTRSGLGVRSGTVPANGVLQVPVAGRLGVPGDPSGVALNVTSVSDDVDAPVTTVTERPGRSSDTLRIDGRTVVE